MRIRHHYLVWGAIALLAGCGSQEPPEAADTMPKSTDSAVEAIAETSEPASATESMPKLVEPRPEIYADFTLDADLDHLSDSQKQMVSVLIDAADIMNGLFWRQAYGDPAPLLDRLEGDALSFAKINYGPWDRLRANEPFVSAVGDKPEGANFYPEDMTREEFEAADLEDKASLYTLLRRDDSGTLITVPYSEAFAEELKVVSDLLVQASELAEDEGFANYLKLRAQAILSNEYYESDMAWMDNKTNPVELVIGPIETYEDQLFGYKAAFEGYVLIKDLEWSDRLSRFAGVLPGLQKNLPVEDAYKAEMPGANADLNAYDVVYYAGDSNAGSKTIAINLPNDERVQLAKGTRRLQLKNAMRAKFDRILVPISERLIDPEQRQNVTFDAFFANTMFHEVAHGLGIKNTLDGSGTVREALKEHASALEEGKADVLGLFMVTQLNEAGELGDQNLMDNYVTFLASIFRSVRFGASSAHGRANMVRFNFFKEAGAFSYNVETGTYRVDFEAMKQAMTDLSALILTIQGDGDYERAGELLSQQGQVGERLEADLAALGEAGIPVDVIFTQGKDVLGL